MRERFEGGGAPSGGTITPNNYESFHGSIGSPGEGAARQKSNNNKWSGVNLTTNNRKASNSHVGNPIVSSESLNQGVTPRLSNGLNLIGNKSKLHSL